MKEELINKVAGEAWDSNRRMIGVEGSKMESLMPSWEQTLQQATTNPYSAYLVEEWKSKVKLIMGAYLKIQSKELAGNMENPIDREIAAA